MSLSTTDRQARITELVRPADGSSQPWLCVLDDGSPWFVKFPGAGPVREALSAELVANRLGRLWHLPIPEPMPVLLDSSVRRAGTDEFWDVLAASVGWNLALRSVPDAVHVAPTLHLPKASLEGILGFDLLLANWDRTLQSRNLLRDAADRLWWIDHGICRFLHLLQIPPPNALPANHFLFGATDGLHPLPLPLPSESSVRAALVDAPNEWLAAIGRDRASLTQELLGYLRPRCLPAAPGGSALGDPG